MRESGIPAPPGFPDPGARGGAVAKKMPGAGWGCQVDPGALGGWVVCSSATARSRLFRATDLGVGTDKMWLESHQTQKCASEIRPGTHCWGDAYAVRSPHLTQRHAS